MSYYLTKKEKEKRVVEYARDKNRLFDPNIINAISGYYWQIYSRANINIKIVQEMNEQEINREIDEFLEFTHSKGIIPNQLCLLLWLGLTWERWDMWLKTERAKNSKARLVGEYLSSLQLMGAQTGVIMEKSTIFGLKALHNWQENRTVNVKHSLEPPKDVDERIWAEEAESIPGVIVENRENI